MPRDENRQMLTDVSKKIVDICKKNNLTLWQAKELCNSIPSIFGDAVLTTDTLEREDSEIQ